MPIIAPPLTPLSLSSPFFSGRTQPQPRDNFPLSQIILCHTRDPQKIPRRLKPDPCLFSLRPAGYFPLNIFIVVVGEGVPIPSPPETPPGAAVVRYVERLKGLIEKIPRDQCFCVEVPGEGRVDLKLRIFVSSSEDSRAIDQYIR